MGDEVLAGVEDHLRGLLGAESGRAAVTFLGAEPIEVLRFPRDDGVVYVTLGMSRAPLPDTDRRAEVVLSLRAPRDDVYRTLAVVALSPVVDNAVVSPGSSIDLGQPLWEGSRFVAFLVGEPGAVADVGEVAFYPLVPMTANEAAFKRVHGAAALEERWLAAGADPRDPGRPEAPLT